MCRHAEISVVPCIKSMLLTGKRVTAQSVSDAFSTLFASLAPLVKRTGKKLLMTQVG